MCSHYETVWHRSLLTWKELRHYHGSQEGHSKGISVIGTNGPRFPRIEAYFKKEPPRGKRCKCGRDAWKCWNRTRSYELMGERRRVLASIPQTPLDT